jgi:thioredoxin reductase
MQAMQEDSDAIIVGGGPAGASCAIWLARLGLRPLLLEARPQLGGLERDNPFPDDWIAALPGLTGKQVAENIERSVAAAGVAVLAAHRVTSIEAGASDHRRGGHSGHADTRDGGAGHRYAVEVQGPSTARRLRASCIVIASGVRPRALPGMGGAPLPGVLVGPGSAAAEQDYTNRSVAILGGGDNAFENYAYVRERKPREVHVYARSVRARRQFTHAADPADVRVGPYVVDPHARSVNGHPYDLMLVLYGWEPQADFAAALALERDERGYIRTEQATAQTSAPGVYAVGEVANRMHPCVVTAMADGVVAAKAIEAALARPD